QDKSEGDEVLEPDTLLAVAMSCESLVRPLLRKGRDLIPLLDKRDQPRRIWTPAEFMLACHMNLSGIEQALIGDDVTEKDRLLACLAYAACTTPEAQTKAFLVGAVRKHLKDQKLELASATAILWSLQVAQNPEFRSDV